MNFCGAHGSLTHWENAAFARRTPKQDIPLYVFMAGSLQIEELPTTSGF
jgi:hypothetical protein